MITPLIDSSIKGNTFENLTKRYIRIAVVLLICVGIATGYAAIPFEEETVSLYQESNVLTNGGVMYE